MRTLTRRVLIVSACTLCLLALLWFLALVTFRLPYRATRHFSCGYCRASMRSETYLGIKLPGEVKKYQFTDYYFRHVDPTHVHVWYPGGSTTTWLCRGTEIGCVNRGGMLPWALHVETCECICKSLPDPAARKAFIESIYLPEPKASEQQVKRYLELKPVMDALNDAYQEDPHRKDWARLLREFKLYPEAGK